jgi:hypothetical protein
LNQLADFFYKYSAPMALPIPSPRLCISALKSFLSQLFVAQTDPSLLHYAVTSRGWSQDIRPAIIAAPISAFVRLRRDKTDVATFGRKPHFNRRRSAEPPLRQRAPIRDSVWLVTMLGQQSSAAVPAAGSGGVPLREGTRGGTPREPAGADAGATQTIIIPPSGVREKFKRVKPLKDISVKQRGWTLDGLDAGCFECFKQLIERDKRLGGGYRMHCERSSQG